jgi:predicted transcriptional regulator of viral defense system
MDASPRQSKVCDVFRRAGGILRTAEALRTGVHPRDLYALRDAGVIEQISRGVYRLADLPPLAEPDLFTVAARIPKAVIALVSAIHYHGLTTEIPHEVSIAVPYGTSRPRLGWPPLRVYWFSGAMFMYGIETHDRDGIRLRVYEPAKTVADCFRFRNRIGIDVALEALRTGLAERKLTQAAVLRAARLCRVERVVRPYLEALQ